MPTSPRLGANVPVTVCTHMNLAHSKPMVGTRKLRANRRKKKKRENKNRNTACSAGSHDPHPPPPRVISSLLRPRAETHARCRCMHGLSCHRGAVRASIYHHVANSISPPSVTASTEYRRQTHKIKSTAPLGWDGADPYVAPCAALARYSETSRQNAALGAVMEDVN